MDRWWALACVPALWLVLTVAGCSDTDPMIKLRRAGAVIEQAFCLVDREEGGASALAEIGVKLIPLFRRSDFLD